MQILVPKRRISAEKLSPMFFLAGPIRGGGDWQHKMCLELQNQLWTAEFVIACPCRWTDAHPLAPNFVADPEGRFLYQLDWEREYLEVAGSRPGFGCVVFWLCCESTESPHPGPEPYAMDTRGELGEWRWRMKTENARVVVGAEPEFLGLSQIRRNFTAALGYDFPIYSSMEETAAAAIKMAFRT